MAEPTKGPWKVKKDLKKFWVESKHKKLFGGRDIAEIDADDNDAEEAKANAKLIAAAPDLLAACVRAERWYKHQLESRNVNADESITIQMLREAIAKAES